MSAARGSRWPPIEGDGTPKKGSPAGAGSNWFSAIPPTDVCADAGELALLKRAAKTPTAAAAAARGTAGILMRRVSYFSRGVLGKEQRQPAAGRPLRAG